MSSLKRRRKVLKANVSRVWCGVMKRRNPKGSGLNGGTHMRTCRDCRDRRRAYWAGFGVPVVWAYGAAIKRRWKGWDLARLEALQSCPFVRTSSRFGITARAAS